MPNLGRLVKTFYLKRGLLIIGVLFLFSAVGLPLLAEAQTTAAPADVSQSFGLDENFDVGVGQDTDLKSQVARVINIILGFLGIIAVLLIMYAGYLYLTARGNEDQVGRAKLILRNALIGLAIIFSAWAITAFVINQLRGASNPGGGDGGGGGGGGIGGSLPGERFTLEEIQNSHGGPASGDNVYRCSLLQPRFNHWVDAPSVAGSRTGFQVLQTIGAGRNFYPPQSLQFDLDARANSLRLARRNNDNPANGDLWPAHSTLELRVPKSLTNTTGQTLADCAAPGCDDRGAYYNWTFTTRDDMDATRPAIAASYPAAIGGVDSNVPRSPVFFASFSEAVDFASLVDSQGLLLGNNVFVEQITAPDNQTVLSKIPSANFDAALSEKGLRFALNKNHRAADGAGPYLEPFAWYRLTISNVKDLCNNDLEKSLVVIFRTNGNTPGVAFAYPNNGYEHACPDTETFVQFRTSMYNVKTGSCAVNSAGGLVLAGGGLPGRTLSAADPVPQSGADTNPNSFCRRYEFLPAGAELGANASYNPSVRYRLSAYDSASTDFKWSFKVKSAQTCANAPYISALSPASGPWGRCASLVGRYFGAAPSGGDAFTKLDMDSTRHFPAGDEDPYRRVPLNWSKNFNSGNGAPWAIAPAAWHDTYLAGEFPNIKKIQEDSINQGEPMYLLPRLREDVADFKVSITRPVQLGGKTEILRSNEVNFSVPVDAPAYQGPCLVNLNPASGAWGASVSLAGSNFGLAPGAVTFSNQASLAQTTSWSASAIAALAPPASQDGLVHVTAGGLVSNGLPFDVNNGSGSCRVDTDCGAGLVCRANQCINPPKTILRPSGFRIEDAWPAKGCVNTCTNAAVGFAANLEINRESLRLATYQAGEGRTGGSVAVLKCQDQACAAFTSSASEAAVLSLGEGNKRANISLALIANASYRVIIYGEAGGLRSVDAKNLVNNNYDANGDGTLDAYSWFFKTGAAACALARLDVDRPSLSLYEGASANLEARGYSRADNCSPADGQLLKPESLGALNWFARAYDKGDIQAECVADGAAPQLGDKNILTINNSSQPHINVVSAVAGTTAGTRVLACVSAAAGTVKTASQVTVFAKCKSDTDCAGAGSACRGSVCNQTTGHCSPTVADINPASGAVGTWVTISGCYFGSTPGTVSGNASNKLFEIPLAMCGQYWTDKSIIAEAPPGLAVSGEAIKITKQNSASAESAVSAQNFITNEVQRPALCRLAPTYGRTGVEVSLYGKNFGSQAAADQVVFYATSTAESMAANDVKEWVDTAERTIIKIAAPVVSHLGDWAVRVVKGAVSSNAVKFNATAAGIDNPQGPTKVVAAQNLLVLSYSPGAGIKACPAIIAEVVLQGALDHRSLAGNFYVRPSGTTAPVAGAAHAFSYGATGTRLSFVPKTALSPSAVYEIVLKSGNSGLRSTTGGTLSVDGVFCKSNQAFAQGECAIGFETIVAGNPAAVAQCEASHLTIEPVNQVYFCAGKDDCENDSHKDLSGNQRVFEARLAAKNGQSLAATAPFAWAVGTSTPAVIEAVIDTADSIKQTQTFTVLPRAGESAVRAAAAVSGKNFKATTLVRVLPCENPWPSYPRAPYVDSDTNFSMLYCRDKGPAGIGGDLPEMDLQVVIGSDGLDDKNPPQSHTVPAGLIKEFLYTVPRVDARGTDAIGIRVIQNQEHDSISEWYSRQAFNKGAPQSIMVDGYKALRDGRTVYVAAPNDRDGDGAATRKIYTNIYLLSVSDGATVETQDIFNQLLSNWRFATNVIDPDNRDALRRDTARLADLRLMANILETRSTLPTLSSGSYLPNLSTSVWPSWKDALASDLGKTLPVDPVNKVICLAGYDNKTCYNKDASLVFQCLAGSRVYQYKYTAATSNYFSLSANLEYQAASWSHPVSRWAVINDVQCANTLYTN